MTMRIKITNEDQSRVARVTTAYVDSQTGKRHDTSSEDVKPGETREFWIYKGLEARVEEI